MTGTHGQTLTIYFPLLCFAAAKTVTVFAQKTCCLKLSHVHDDLKTLLSQRYLRIYNFNAIIKKKCPDPDVRKRKSTKITRVEFGAAKFTFFTKSLQSNF